MKAEQTLKKVLSNFDGNEESRQRCIDMIKQYADEHGKKCFKAGMNKGWDMWWNVDKQTEKAIEKELKNRPKPK